MISRAADADRCCGGGRGLRYCRARQESHGQAGGAAAEPVRPAAATGAGLAPVPPYLPPGQVINLAGRGEVFVRDSGDAPADPAILLRHGWTASADLNFFPVYAELAGSYRVIALDLRGQAPGTG
jgi:pimeloyl-ACP methyl ester carboxylesterase